MILTNNHASNFLSNLTLHSVNTMYVFVCMQIFKPCICTKCSRDMLYLQYICTMSRRCGKSIDIENIYSQSIQLCHKLSYGHISCVERKIMALFSWFSAYMGQCDVIIKKHNISKLNSPDISCLY